MTPLQLDTLREIINTGIGRAAAALNEMVDSPIDLEAPAITITSPGTSAIPAGLDQLDLACVQLGFQGAINGSSALVFPPSGAAELVAALTGLEPGPDTSALNAVMAGTLNEIGNIIINGVIGTISNILAEPFDYSVPNYREGRLNELFLNSEALGSATVLLVRTTFVIRDLHVEGNIFLIFELGSFEVLLAAIDAMLAS